MPVVIVIRDPDRLRRLLSCWGLICPQTIRSRGKIMTNQAHPVEAVIGADVSKDTVTLCLGTNGEIRTVPNTAEDLKTALRAFGPVDLVVCEATGGYERTLLGVTLDLGLRAHRADAARIKAFIASYGVKAKTDAIDALWIARYGLERGARLAPWVPMEKTRETLLCLARRRETLVRDRTQELNRLKGPNAEVIKAMVEEHIAFLSHQIEDIESRINDLMKADEPLAKAEEKLMEIKGIGSVAARTLLLFMPELGTLTRRQAASLAGLAPHPKDSGKKSGHRATGRGRRALRSKLFMAALSAVRYNPDLKAFYE
ncbi:IS110 family transposase, partial [Roseospira navarrensis]|uniref:IS110 family transposase n=1 Tax=Roseospira navarrensis TaxID=140058 RepID=UPI0014784FF7